jgi:hypothetical protein
MRRNVLRQFLYYFKAKHTHIRYRQITAKERTDDESFTSTQGSWTKRLV